MLMELHRDSVLVAFERRPEVRDRTGKQRGLQYGYRCPRMGGKDHDAA